MALTAGPTSTGSIYEIDLNSAQDQNAQKDADQNQNKQTILGYPPHWLVLFCIVAALAKPLGPLGARGGADRGRPTTGPEVATPAEGPVRGICRESNE